jgi:hypothetical protein
MNKRSHLINHILPNYISFHALLCGVFVRLHLALFSAGGPFLPSLDVNLYYFVLSLCKSVYIISLCIYLCIQRFLHDDTHVSVHCN